MSIIQASFFVQTARRARPFDSAPNACYILRMNTLQGISASGGFVKGTAYVLSVRARHQIQRIPIAASEIPQDWQRFENARTKTLDYFNSLIDKTNARQAAIFQTYTLMLSDPDFIAQIKKEHDEAAENAEWIVEKKVTEYADKLRASGDSYLIERAEDIIDVYGKLIDNLLGNNPLQADDIPPKTVLCAEFLSPSDAVLLSKKDLSAIVLHKGAPNSHLAILARTYGIPMIFGIEDIAHLARTGDEIIVDGNSGKIFIQPDESTRTEYERKIIEEKARAEKRAAFSGKSGCTKDGFAVKLYANIGSAKEAEIALEEGADGIGLFRTEFLFMGASDTGEEAQFNEYRAVLEVMKDKPVVIRTLDAGGDKIIAGQKLPSAGEKNPLLGRRAIRLCLAETELFKTQLRALLRSSVYGNLKIMLPLLTDISELHKTKKIIEEVKAELSASAVPFNKDVPLGLMIETPAAALTADVLANEAAFFSIGSNDLTQYTLCIDRENELVAPMFDELHPAVRRLIASAVRAAHERGIPVSVCGEMAAHGANMLLLMSMGIKHFSVSPKKINDLKEVLSRFTFGQIESLKEWADSPKEGRLIKEKLQSFF